MVQVFFEPLYYLGVYTIYGNKNERKQDDDECINMADENGYGVYHPVKICVNGIQEWANMLDFG